MTYKTKAELEALIASIDDMLALIGCNSLFAPTAETLKSKRAEAQAALAAKEVVDPLLMEAREICARVCEGWRDIPSERAHAYRCGSHDDEADVAYALAALRRGMELASAPAETVEAELEASLGPKFKHLAPIMAQEMIPALVEGLHAQIFAVHSGGDPVASHDALGDGGQIHETVHALVRAMPARTLAHRGAVWPGDGRCKVPVGQTPLDDNLHHRLLDVIKEGQQCRDDGTGSPYHGRSLEHCLHATGWVQRDLRLALDEAKAEIECLRAYQTGGDV